MAINKVSSQEVENKQRSLQKKLRQIASLKRTLERGGTLDADAQNKVAMEAALLEELKSCNVSLPRESSPTRSEARGAPMNADEQTPQAPHELRSHAEDRIAFQLALSESAIEHIQNPMQALLSSKAMQQQQSGALPVPASPGDSTDDAALIAASRIAESQFQKSAQQGVEVVRDLASEEIEALALPPDNLNSLIGGAATKRFHLLQKKLRQVCKLSEKDQVDSLQQAKVAKGPGIIKELLGLRAQALEAAAGIDEPMTVEYAQEHAVDVAPFAKGIAKGEFVSAESADAHLEPAAEAAACGTEFDSGPKQTARKGFKANSHQISGKGQRKGEKQAAGVVLLVGGSSGADQVVITCQLRRGRPSWELPKGGIEHQDHSSVEAAAAREFWEETGVTNELRRMIPLQGYGAKRIHWHLARVRTKSDLLWGPIEDKDTLEARCVPVREALEILRNDHRQLLNDIIRDIKQGRL